MQNEDSWTFVPYKKKNNRREVTAKTQTFEQWDGDVNVVRTKLATAVYV